MTARRGEEGHVNDATLIQLIDGALGGGAAARVEHHLAACPECADRRRTVLRRSERLHAVYEAATPVNAPLPDRWLAPARRAVRPRWSAGRIAAAAAFVVAASLLVSPVYAYLSRVIADIRADQAKPQIASPDVPPRGPAPSGPTDAHQEPPPSAIRFQPSGTELTIQFAAIESGAHIEVRASRASHVAFEAGGTAGQERPVLVLPAALDVSNAGRTGGVYRVWVPRSMARVRIEIAGRVVSSVVPGDPSDGPNRIAIGR